MREKRLTEAELMKARQAILQIARRERRSVDEVRQEMVEALRIGLSDPDPRIRAAWQEIPCAGKIPTPEEVIAWSTRRIKRIITDH